MPIDSVGNFGSALAALRAELVSKGEFSKRSGATRKIAGSRPASRASLKKTLEGLAQSMRTGYSHALARERMVRAVLQWEFGPEVREHPEWARMVETVDAALAAADPTGERWTRFISAL